MKPRVVEETRLINFRELARKEGGVTAMAEKLGKAQAQWQNTIGKTPTKVIGSVVARQVEAKYRLPTGWADMPWDLIESSRSVRLDAEKLAGLIEAVELTLSKLGRHASPKFKAGMISSLYTEDVGTGPEATAALQVALRSILSSIEEQK
jgi:hypothetical protein